HRLAAQVGQRDFLAVIGLEAQLRRRVSLFEHVAFFLLGFPGGGVPPGYWTSRLSVWFTSCGLAWPREARITWPTKTLNTPSFPARYLATLSGFLAMTSRH